MAETIEDACAAMSRHELGLEPPEEVAAAFDGIVPQDDASLVRSAASTGVTADHQRTLEELCRRCVGGDCPP